ncbi:MAG: hypothetical protein ACOYK8_02705 [Alphaproteobacteria bacterium]
MGDLDNHLKRLSPTFNAVANLDNYNLVKGTLLLAKELAQQEASASPPTEVVAQNKNTTQLAEILGPLGNSHPQEKTSSDNMLLFKMHLEQFNQRLLGTIRSESSNISKDLAKTIGEIKAVLYELPLNPSFTEMAKAIQHIEVPAAPSTNPFSRERNYPAARSGFTP